jgi:hypothetical protein
MVSVGGGMDSEGVAGVVVVPGVVPVSPPIPVSLLRSLHAARSAATAHRGIRNFVLMSGSRTVVVRTRTVTGDAGVGSQSQVASCRADVRRKSPESAITEFPA